MARMECAKLEAETDGNVAARRRTKFIDVAQRARRQVGIEGAATWIADLKAGGPRAKVAIAKSAGGCRRLISEVRTDARVDE